MNSTWELFVAKAKKDGISVNLHKSGNSHFSANMLIKKTFPTLIQSKKGSREIGGGSWQVPELCIQLAQGNAPH